MIGALFRARGREITRLEALSDGTFAFAITLLVVSLEVPRTFDQLQAAMRGFPAFGVCFAILMWIWYQHTRFFRRYALEDPATVALNGMLLFVVLFYVYPMKFLWTMLASGLAGDSFEVERADGRIVPMIERSDASNLLIVYSVGFTAIFVCLALLYVRAYHRRAHLELSPVEVFDTRSGIVENLAVAGVGVFAMLLASIMPPRLAGLAGMSYVLIGVVKWIHGDQHARRRRRLEERLTGAE
jgi:uncharacterized membrane protein